MSKLLRVPLGPPARVDRVLAEALEGVSRREIRRLLAEGRVRIDGRAPRKAERLAPGSDVTLEIEDESHLSLAAEPGLAFPVLHLDQDLVAIDKPAGCPGHAVRPGDRGTVANFLAARFPESREASTRPGEHGLVHRLDTATSGVLLAALHRAAWLDLREQFRRREVGKIYVAVVEGSLDAEGRIDRAIASLPGNRRRVRVLSSAQATGRAARPAETRFRPLARAHDRTLLEVEIPTGARHQIRAHLAAIGHPVVGDPLYGRSTGGGRLLLHASSLTLRHPRTGRRLRIESPLPPDFPALADHSSSRLLL